MGGQFKIGKFAHATFVVLLAVAIRQTAGQLTAGDEMTIALAAPFVKAFDIRCPEITPEMKQEAKVCLQGKQDKLVGILTSEQSPKKEHEQMCSLMREAGNECLLKYRNMPLSEQCKPFILELDSLLESVKDEGCGKDDLGEGFEKFTKQGLMSCLRYHVSPYVSTCLSKLNIQEDFDHVCTNLRNWESCVNDGLLSCSPGARRTIQSLFPHVNRLFRKLGLIGSNCGAGF